MPLLEDMKAALEKTGAEKTQAFDEQLAQYEAFRKRMEEAGVTPAKRDFTIPLMERIGTIAFSED